MSIKLFLIRLFSIRLLSPYPVPETPTPTATATAVATRTPVYATAQPTWTPLPNITPQPVAVEMSQLGTYPVEVTPLLSLLIGLALITIITIGILLWYDDQFPQ
jgi:hypothetical protein